MLEPATMALLAKIKILAKKMGTNIDLVKMTEDRNYATLTLQDLSNSDDQELVLIVINLMDKFGMIKAPLAQDNSEEPNAQGRYVGALR